MQVEYTTCKPAPVTLLQSNRVRLSASLAIRGPVPCVAVRCTGGLLRVARTLLQNDECGFPSLVLESASENGYRTWPAAVEAVEAVAWEEERLVLQLPVGRLCVADAGHVLHSLAALDIALAAESEGAPCE